MQNAISLALTNLRPAAGPSAALVLSLLAGALDPHIIFTRASTGTYFDSAGVLRTAAVDAPRFNHDPVTLQPKGLLIEDARTNLFTYSNQLDNAAWTKVRCSVSPDVATAPDGTLTADKLVEDTSNNSHVIGRNISFISGVAYTATLVIEAAGRTQVALVFPSGAFTTSRILFDLSAVTAVVTLGAATATIQYIGGGRYLCTATATATATASAFVEVRLCSGGSDTYLGNGVSGVNVGGTQIEAGASSSSLILTTAAAVPRAADIAPMTGANFSSWYNPLEGTFVWDFGENNGTVVGGVGDTFDNTQYLTATSGSVNIRSANVVSTGITTAASPAGARIAWAYKLNDFAVSRNGAAVVTDTLGDVPISPVRLMIGSNPWGISGGNSLFGHIRRLDYYNTRLPNADLQRLTA